MREWMRQTRIEQIGNLQDRRDSPRGRTPRTGKPRGRRKSREGSGSRAGAKEPMSWEDHESKRMEPAGSGATWTGSPEGVFAGRKHHKPGLALNNNTAGVREPSDWSGGPSDIEGKTTRVGASECGQRTSFNRTRVAGHLDEIQSVVASTPALLRNGAVGFIDWLDLAM